MAELALAGAAAATLLSTEIVIAGITIGTVGGLLATAALSGASYLINQALIPELPSASIDEGQKLTVQQSVPVQRLIYGRALVGGPIFFYECKPPYLYIGIVLASHEIDGVEQVLVNGRRVTFDAAGNIGTEGFVIGGIPYLTVSFRMGMADQLIDPILAADFAELPSTFRQRGHATAVLKCYYGADADEHGDVWGQGTPQFLFLVKGMKVYDPRNPAQSSSDAATWAWSDNAALCIAHYLTYAKGAQRSWDKIDLAALQQAANDDATAVALLDGTYEARYTINGVIELTSDPLSIILDMLTANLGRLIWRDGKYVILSGVPRAPVWTLTDESARGPMEVRMHRDRAGLVNSVRTVFTATDREYKTANGPVLTNSAYVTADGEEHAITITLPFTASHTRAQRIAKATMENARYGKTLARRESLDAIRLNAADIVNVEVGFLPVMGGVFEIESMTFDPETMEVEIEAEEYSAAMYDWIAANDEQPFAIEPAELAGVN